MLLNKEGRVQGVETVAEPLGIRAVAERPNLHGEKTDGGIDAAKNFHANRHYAGTDRIHFLRGGKGEIDDAVVDERAAIGDSHHGGLAIDQVSNANHRFERQRAVSRRELVHVVGLAVRSAPSVKWHAIPGSVAFFCVTRRSRRSGRLASFRSSRASWPSRGSFRHVSGSFALSAVFAGVSVGCDGGGWR